jgi:hypothetical protein
MIDKSFFLVRTNPALTGNVKVVISSDYNLYLESFSTNKDLSRERFKHYEVKHTELLKESVPYFFKDVEEKSIFEVKDTRDKTDMYTDYAHQFDDTYFSGAFFNEDTWHGEEYEYFAPLYLNRERMPSNFIVLRVDGAGSINQSSSALNFRKEIVDKWKFVKMFDFAEETPLGGWMKRNFKDDEAFTTYPMVVRHGDTELSQLSGMDVRNGGWVTKYVNLSDIQTKNAPIFRTEEYFTKLWEDNGLLYPHIVNFKFLFDDTPASATELRKYSLNRYVGFYVDAVETVKTISPYRGFELNSYDPYTLSTLTAQEVSEVPYVLRNTFVREVNGKLNTFDPIKNGWRDEMTYWVEFNGNLYRLARVENTGTAIFGKYLYKIMSDMDIKHEVSEEPNSTVRALKEKVLINELSTFHDRVEIKHEVKFNNITARNLITNTSEVVSRLIRVFDYYMIEGKRKYLFRIDVETVRENRFAIRDENGREVYDEADLYLMEINGMHHVIKRYPDNVPNVGGMYYVQSDWAVNVNSVAVTTYINNGHLTKDPLYYNSTNIEHVGEESTPVVFNIVRVGFSDIKDFDFDRVETDYSRYEYEKTNELTPSLEPKLYAKEHRDLSVKIKTLSNTDPHRVPIKDENGRPYTVRAANGELNPLTGMPYKDTELYQQDFGGGWMVLSAETGETAYREDTVSLTRKYYREENYIWRKQDNNDVYEMDFTAQATPRELSETLTWGEDGLSEIGDAGATLTKIPFKDDPNDEVDLNYVPVSSEYIQSDELWELRAESLTSIWNKNQYVCKWGYLNSIAAHDLPYRLNYSLEMGSLFNRTSNALSTRSYPVRANRDLDYFYRFGLTDAESYQYYSLHLNEEYFDIDRYLSTEYNYFETLFKTDQVTSQGLMLTNKYSSFLTDNVYEEPYTLFKGVKYKLLDVDQVILDEDEYEATGKVVIDNILTAVDTKYKDYGFSVVFGRKMSHFNNNQGKGDGNFGVDVYLNDHWKNVVIHLYVNTDDVIEVRDALGELINIETCPIDVLYRDNVAQQDTDPDAWDMSEFKINGFNIQLRPRDLMLKNVLRILGDFNHSPDNMDDVGFIHVYSDGSVSERMSYRNSDFIIKTELPESFLVREESFDVTPTLPSTRLEVNNSLRNRIINSDKGGDANFTTNGLRVNSVGDINAYNDYPVARLITEKSGEKHVWELDEETSPRMYRYSGVYVPIFKNIPLFRPMKYNGMAGAPLLRSGNWKFYDPEGTRDKPVLKGFGQVDEIIFSKCNPVSNVLKIQGLDGKHKSIYPMVDEYGYDFDSKYLFSSNWEKDYNYLSRKIEVEPNTYPSIAGYTLQYNGKDTFLRIPDNVKFNAERFLIEETNFEGNITDKPLVGTPSTNKLTIPLGDTPVADLPDAVKRQWGGYLKKDIEGGDILGYAFQTKAWKTYPAMVEMLRATLKGKDYTITYNDTSNHLVIESSDGFEFEPERWTYIKDGNTITYEGTKTGDASKVCSVLLKLYPAMAETEVVLGIQPDNGAAVSIILQMKGRDITDIVAQMNAQMEGEYVATVSKSTDVAHTIRLAATLPGAYYNFDVNTHGAEFFYTDSPVERVQVERTYFENFHKTSLKEGGKRLTGYVNEFTIEFFLKFNPNTKSFETVAYKGADMAEDVWEDSKFRDFTWVIGKYGKTDKLAFKTCHIGLDGKHQVHTLVSRLELNDNETYHVAFVFDAITRTKMIMVDGELDIRVSEFLSGGIAKSVPGERELAVQFLQNRARLIQGNPYDRMGNEVALADRIRLNSKDDNTTYWYEVIRGFRVASEADLAWQLRNWKVTITDAFRAFKENYHSFGYYAPVSLNGDWDILIGTDSVQAIGRRNLMGTVDELKLWNYARTETQIRDNYRFISRPETYLNPLRTLVAYYRFDEGHSADTIMDLMHGKTVKDMVKWGKIRVSNENDGRGAVMVESADFFQFVSEYYEGANIAVPETLTWVISDADLIGYSDERYSIEQPKPSHKKYQVRKDVILPKKSKAIEQTLELKDAETVTASGAAVSEPIAVKIAIPNPSTIIAAEEEVNVVMEPVPEVYKRKEIVESAIVNVRNDVTEEIPTKVSGSKPILRAEERLSSKVNGASKKMSLYARLMSYITKKR